MTDALPCTMMEARPRIYNTKSIYDTLWHYDSASTLFEGIILMFRSSCTMFAIIVAPALMSKDRTIRHSMRLFSSSIAKGRAFMPNENIGTPSGADRI